VERPLRRRSPLDRGRVPPGSPCGGPSKASPPDARLRRRLQRVTIRYRRGSFAAGSIPRPAVPPSSRLTAPVEVGASGCGPSPLMLGRTVEPPSPGAPAASTAHELRQTESAGRHPAEPVTAHSILNPPSLRGRVRGCNARTGRAAPGGAGDSVPPESRAHRPTRTSRCLGGTRLCAPLHRLIPSERGFRSQPYSDRGTKPLTTRSRHK
jgi:hypothetical protein